MFVLGVIPARLGSTRLERKPLQSLLGRSLIQWTCKSVSQSQRLDDLIVATDSEEVAYEVEKEGYKACMTRSDLASGTDRVFEVSQKFQPDLVVNIQGDEPLIQAQEIDNLIDFILSKEMDCWATLGSFLSWEDLKDSHTVKVIKNIKDEAIYFSRFGIPFSREVCSITNPNETRDLKEGENNIKSPFVKKHVGVYAYTYKALRDFFYTPPCHIEKSESLEQLRALHLGTKIFVKDTSYNVIGVNTLEDLKRVESLLEEKKR